MEYKSPIGQVPVDGDITKVGDKLHLFYVPHDGTPGIKYNQEEKK